MKSKDCYIKRVYRQIPFKGGYWFDSDHSLGKDFFAIGVLAGSTYVNYRFKVEYYDRNLQTYVTGWKDKHGNIIVRMLQSNKQIKINF